MPASCFGKGSSTVSQPTTPGADVAAPAAPFVSSCLVHAVSSFAIETPAVVVTSSPNGQSHIPIQDETEMGCWWRRIPLQVGTDLEET
ncbi:hypothetical protein AAHA92_33455 [Salvia divinorum]|uniref:Uncharacterized protein n=1 Tax=Salvia divinorum TaxID=28513 RepID=A0ABD1FS27_SALDI